MRNLFDQYNQPENRLTHALAVCLDEDRALLSRFVGWIAVKPPVRATELVIAEQDLPGDAPVSEEQAERKGLPDIVIHDGEAWALLIESKVQAALPHDAPAHGELPNRLLTAFEVTEFVGCHEETVRRAYLRGLLVSQRFGVRGRRFHPNDVFDWIRRGAPTRPS